MPKPTAHGLRFDLQSVVLIVGWAVTVAGLYYGLSGKLDTQGVLISSQTNTIQSLSDRVKTGEEAGRALERALVELTVTLRVKDVIK